MDSGIQSLNNRGQEKSTYRLNLFVEYHKLNRRLFSKHVYRLKWTEWTSVWFVKRYLKLRSTELNSGIHWAYWPIFTFLFTYNVHLLTLAAVRFLATIIWRANTKSFVSPCLLSNSWKSDTIFFFFSVQEFFSQADFLARQDFFSPRNQSARTYILLNHPYHPSFQMVGEMKKILALILGDSSRFSLPRSKYKDLYSEKHRQTNNQSIKQRNKKLFL